MLIFTSVYFITPHVTAESIQQQIQDARKKSNELEGKRSNLQSEQKHKQSEIEHIRSDQKKIDAEIKRIDLAIEETRANIRQKETEIKNTEQQIAVLEQEIAELQQRIEERDEMLKTRVRSVQQNGGMINYLDVLLGAQSFGDFIDRASAVSVIVQQDKKILQQHIEEKELLEKKKQELSELLSSLTKKREELKKLEEQFIAQRNEKNALMEQLKEKEQQIEEELLDIKEQEEILAKQQQAMEKLIKQLEEQEKRRQEAIKRGEKPPVTDGTFMRPANGPVTSEFGQRWGRLHAGIDIGKRGNDVPVVAVADGIVFRSYYSSTYGNVVFITHNVDGQVYTTVYAHLENRAVSEGEVVSKGQTLGYMGNTGRSFGAHLHFEIHKGQWNASKTNAINPRTVIDF